MIIKIDDTVKYVSANEFWTLENGWTVYGDFADNYAVDDTGERYTLLLSGDKCTYGYSDEI